MMLNTKYSSIVQSIKETNELIQRTSQTLSTGKTKATVLSALSRYGEAKLNLISSQSVLLNDLSDVYSEYPKIFTRGSIDNWGDYGLNFDIRNVMYRAAVCNYPDNPEVSNLIKDYVNNWDADYPFYNNDSLQFGVKVEDLSFYFNGNPMYLVITTNYVYTDYPSYSNCLNGHIKQFRIGFSTMDPLNGEIPMFEEQGIAPWRFRDDVNGEGESMLLYSFLTLQSFRNIELDGMLSTVCANRDYYLQDHGFNNPLVDYQHGYIYNESGLNITETVRYDKYPEFFTDIGVIIASSYNVGFGVYQNQSYQVIEFWEYDPPDDPYFPSLPENPDVPEVEPSVPPADEPVVGDEEIDGSVTPPDEDFDYVEVSDKLLEIIQALDVSNDGKPNLTYAAEQLGSSIIKQYFRYDICLETIFSIYFGQEIYPDENRMLIHLATDVDDAGTPLPILSAEYKIVGNDFVGTNCFRYFDDFIFFNDVSLDQVIESLTQSSLIDAYIGEITSIIHNEGSISTDRLTLIRDKYHETNLDHDISVLLDKLALIDDKVNADSLCKALNSYYYDLRVALNSISDNDTRLPRIQPILGENLLYSAYKGFGSFGSNVIKFAKGLTNLLFSICKNAALSIAGLTDNILDQYNLRVDHSRYNFSNVDPIVDYPIFTRQIDINDGWFKKKNVDFSRGFNIIDSMSHRIIVWADDRDETKAYLQIFPSSYYYDPSWICDGITKVGNTKISLDVSHLDSYFHSLKDCQFQSNESFNDDQEQWLAFRAALNALQLTSIFALCVSTSNIKRQYNDISTIDIVSGQQDIFDQELETAENIMTRILDGISRISVGFQDDTSFLYRNPSDNVPGFAANCSVSVNLPTDVVRCNSDSYSADGSSWGLKLIQPSENFILTDNVVHTSIDLATNVDFRMAAVSIIIQQAIQEMSSMMRNNLTYINLNSSWMDDMANILSILTQYLESNPGRVLEALNLIGYNEAYDGNLSLPPVITLPKISRHTAIVNAITVIGVVTVATVAGFKIANTVRGKILTTVATRQQNLTAGILNIGDMSQASLEDYRNIGLLIRKYNRSLKLARIFGVSISPLSVASTVNTIASATGLSVDRVERVLSGDTNFRDEILTNVIVDEPSDDADDTNSEILSGMIAEIKSIRTKLF